MRALHSWLAELVPGLPDADTCARALTFAGIKVETIDRIAGCTGVVVGEVLDIEELAGFKKPIRYVAVRTEDGGEARGVICGATNFAVGDRVPVALPGAVLPGGFRIDVRKAYGRKSDGMICSAAELGIGDDHRGILVLPSDTPLGVDVAGLFGVPDAVLELEVTTDRGYALSARGLARELATACRLPFQDPAALPVPVADPAEPGYPVRIDDEAGCVRYVARLVEGFDADAVSPPRWLSKLALCGMRPISAAVDVTNLVLLGLGQPLHAFDADKLTGPIVVRRARAGERLVTLDGEDRALSRDDLVIADDTGPVALAGVMGGEATEIGPQTRRILLESACFDPTSVARTARRHGLHSEASRRFERGVDPALAAAAAETAVRMLADVGGARPAGVTDVDLRGPIPAIELPVGEATRLGGRDYPRDVVEARLREVGCTVSDAADPADPADPAVLVVTPPSWRPDLQRPADLVEEVLRLEGYDTVPVRLPRAPAQRGLTAAQRARRRAVAALADAGFDEVLLLPFTAGDVADRLGLAPDDPRRAAERVANPIAEDEAYLRTTLLPGLLAAVSRNVGHGQDAVALFETGTVFRTRSRPSVPVLPPVDRRPTEEELAAIESVLPDQPRHLGAVLAGTRVPAGWWGHGRPADWSDAVESARVVARAVGASLLVRRGEAMPWHPGRCAQLAAGGAVVGHAGELHPRVIAAFDLPARTCAMELDLDALIAAAGPPPRVALPSPYPLAERDVALVVDADAAAADVAAALTDGAGPLLESLALFDVYEQVGPGQRSLAYRLRWRAPDRTLTAEEVNELRDAAVRAATERTGARLRT